MLGVLFMYRFNGQVIRQKGTVDDECGGSLVWIIIMEHV